MTHHPKAPAKRARLHVQNLLEVSPSQTPKSPAADGPLGQATQNIAELPLYQFFPELSASFVDPVKSFQRGIFRRIQADQIDLPPPRSPPNPNDAGLWISKLPPNIQPLFTTASQTFRDAITEHTKQAKVSGTLPPPRLYAPPDEYVKLLAKAEQAGMLHWSDISQEDKSYSKIATDIEMTLFAVSKSHDRSRLISWPRVQNDAVPEPPWTSLPNPAMFDAVTVHGRILAAFFLDISNMFHNITLPMWLARLFPMKPIPFDSLPTDTQNRIAARITLPDDTSNVMLRACQATMPMGFKWAVFISHTFVSSCFDQSFRLLKSCKAALPSMELSKLRAEDAPFIVTARSPLLLHIIDDAAAVTIDWPPSLVISWHRITRTILANNKLPIAERKSSCVNEVVRDAINFIGCKWELQTGVIVPSEDKLAIITKQAKALLEARSIHPEHWERIIGKLIWVSMLNRPLLACTQSIFFPPNPVIQPGCCNAPPPSNKREVRTLTALLPFARVEINLPISHIVVAFDASTNAGAVTYTYATDALAANQWKAAQSARFTRDHDYSSQLPEVKEVVQACRWKLAFTHYWKKDEHINCLEAATAVLSIEWLTRSRQSHTRAIFLTDSLVALGALQKGRSSKPGLLLRCRRFAATALAHNLRICLAYVRSECNPADEYTRLEKPKL